jgi:hypothetical protein
VRACAARRVGIALAALLACGGGVEATGEIEPLFPRGGAGTAPDVAAGPVWGDPDCPGPPSAAFSPHGIDLASRLDGAL